LLLWYSVITALFRCPGSILDITDDSPKVCKPYLQLRDHATPYVQPYYNAYLKEYVDRAQPHVDSLNKKVLTPATIFAKDKYDIYGAPRVAQLQDYAEGTWSSTLKPRLEIRRKWAKNEYDKQLGPYVDQARRATEPYAKKVYSELVDMYETTLIPLYHRAVPIANDVYQQGSHITTDVIFPNVQYAQQVTFDFLRRQLWPTLVVLYGENVEPQLTKITERLGRYKDSKKLQAAIDEVNVSTASSVPPLATPSASQKVGSAEPERKASPTPVPSPEPEQGASPIPVPSPDPAPVVEDVDTREKIESDLTNWKQKFAIAADKGAADLKLRVFEITSRQVENQAQGTGQALVTQLQETAKSQIENLKSDIIKLVEDIPEDADQKTEDSYYDKVVQKVRTAGSAIKEKAQAIREWEQKYDEDTTALVNAALESTLKIVDSIRDLGLQQIGMRWANIESVTYEDWSSYHDLKSEFDEWRTGVEDAALKHEGLTAARTEGDHVREAAMKEAQSAVAELVRLRDASKWKIATRDSTDDFSNKVVPPKVKKAAQSLTDKVKSAAGSSSKPSPSRALDGASDSLSEAIASATSSIAELFDDGFSSAESLASTASSVVDGAAENLKPSVGSVVSAAKFKTEQVSSAIIGTPPPPESQASSSISSAYESLSSQASSNLESVSSVVADEASTASSKVFGGAMAARVEAKQFPIFDSGFTFDDDEDETLSEKIESFVSAAGDRASDLTSAVNEALKGLTATPTQGTVESVTSIAGDKVAAALSAASEALYGTTPGVLESASSVAVDKYAQAVTAYVLINHPFLFYPLVVAGLEWSMALEHRLWTYCASISSFEAAHRKCATLRCVLLVSSTPNSATL
jgi:hypothetical protein